MTEERSFEVVDRRRVRPSEEAAAEETAPAAVSAPEGGAGDEPLSESVGETGGASREEAGAESEEAEGEEISPEQQAAFLQFQEHMIRQLLGGLPASDVLRLACELLAERAWIGMGLRLGPGEGEPRVDLAEARLAIDSLTALQPLASRGVEPAAARELETVLTNARLNFVRVAGAAGGQGPGPD